MTATISPPSPVSVQQATPQFDGVMLEGIRWETYEQLRSDLDRAGQHVRIVYDDGRMAVMAPLGTHDRGKRLLGRMVDILSIELNIPIASFGSTTWKRKDLRKGLEPDEGYYVQHEPQIGGRMELDLKRDPPPDLVLEVEGTRSPVEKFPVYAALGVPEIWHYDGTTLQFLLLKDRRQFEPAQTSLAFPVLTPADLKRFLDMVPARGEHATMLAFRDWVRTLRPHP